MEAVSVVKQESGQIVLSNDNEVFVMNYDIDEDLHEGEPSAENSQGREQEPAAKEVTSEMEVEEQGLEDVDIKEEELQVCHGKNNKNKKSTDINDDGLKEDQWINPKLKKNLETAGPEKKITCAICGFRTLKKHHLSSHIKLAHPKNQPSKSNTFDCEYCMFSSKYKPSLTHHVSRFHMDKVLIAESKTPAKKKSSFDVQSLKVEDHVTLGKDHAYSCNYCSYASKNLKLMTIHAPIHIVDKRPVKQCPHCPIRYTESVLKVHIQKVHNPEGLYKCPKCPYATKFPNNLRRHKKQNANLEKCLLTKPRKASLYTNDPKVKKKSNNKK